MNKKYLIPVLLVGAGIAFWFWNQNRIAKLKSELAKIQSETIPHRTEINKWGRIIQILLALGMDVYAQFKPGGAFYNGNETLGDFEIDELIRQYA